MPAPWIGNEVTDWITATLDEQAVTGTSRIRGGVAISSGSGPWAMSPLQPPRTTAGVRFSMYSNNGSSMLATRAFFTLRNAADVPVLRMWLTAANTMQPQYWDGATWINVDTAKGTGWNTGVFGAFELFATGCGTAAGSLWARFYINGVLTAEWTGTGLDFTDVTDIARLYISSMYSTGTFTLRVGEAVIQDGDPTGILVYNRGPSGNGADVGGTGDYTTVDEFPASDADFNILSTVGERRSVVTTARDFQGRRVTGVQFAVRARCGTEGPQAIKLYVVVGGVRYYSPTMTLTVAHASYVYCWDTNPATGVRWLNPVAEAASLEFGWEAV